MEGLFIKPDDIPKHEYDKVIISKTLTNVKKRIRKGRSMRDSSICFENIIEINNKRYIFDNVRSCFMELNMDEMSVTPLAVVSRPKETEKSPLSYGKIISVGNKIYAVPTIPAPVIVYDIVADTISYIGYNIDFSFFPGCIFSDVQLIGDVLFFIPCYYGSILCIDTKDDSVKYISLRETLCDDSQTGFAYRGFYYIDRCLCFSMLTDNRFISVNYDTYDVEILRTEIPEGEKIEGIIATGGDVWAFPMRANKVFKLDKINLRIKNILTEFPDNYKCGDFSFSDIALIGKYIYLLPRDNNMVIRLDTDNDLFDKVIEKGNNSASYFEKYCYYSCVSEYENKVYIFESGKDVVHIFDNNLEKKTKITLRNGYKKGRLIIYNSFCFPEDKYISLNSFISSI